MQKWARDALFTRIVSVDRLRYAVRYEVTNNLASCNQPSQVDRHFLNKMCVRVPIETKIFDPFSFF